VTIDRYRGPRRIRLDGERLAALRIAKNHSLAHVALACGVTRQAVCLWEQERSVPDDRAIEGLTRVFGDELSQAVSVKVWE
jgi:predicted transcriptional regulator